MIEDVWAGHGVVGGCTTGRGAKPGGTLIAGARTGNGGKPVGTTIVGRGTGMGGVTTADLSQKYLNH
jgi:hypothetical protein